MSMATIQAPATVATATPRPGALGSAVCRRCGGEGKLWHFSNVLGGVCFRCNGRGWQFTAPGELANKFLIFLRSKMACEVKAGELVRVELGSPLGRQVTKFEPCVRSEMDKPTGSFHDERGFAPLGWVLEYHNEKFGGLSSHSSLWSMVRVAQSAEQKASTLAAAVQFQAKLTAAGKLRKGVTLTPDEKRFLAGSNPAMTEEVNHA